MRRTILASLLAATALPTPSCVMHTHVTDWSGVDGIRGQPVELQITTSYALHFLYVFGLFGDAGKASTVREFTAEASARGATRVSLVETSSETYWYIFLPLSWIVHPVVTTVAGEVEGTVSEAP